MALEIATAPRRMNFQPISWSAIFAALAVGIALQMFLMLAGVAVGGLVMDPGAQGAREMATGAAIWNGISMLIAAFVGGYVASRSSGLRRKGDGVLHGAVAWAASALLYAILAMTVLSNATAGLFSQLKPVVQQAIPSSAQQAPQSIDRNEVAQTLRNLGMSEQQAQSVIEQMGAMRDGQAASPETRANVEEAADRVGMATGGLTLAVLLSLLAGILGGLTGTLGQRRVRRRAEAVGNTEARVLSRNTTPI